MPLPRVGTWLKVLKNLPALLDALKDVQRVMYALDRPVPDSSKLWREIGMLQQRVDRVEDRVMGLTRLYAGDEQAERLPTRHDDFSGDTAHAKGP